MPTIEVRSLDLRTPEVAAELFPRGSDRIAVRELNYVWIYVEDITTQTEVPFRFRVVDKRLVLGLSHDTAEQVVATLHGATEHGVRLLADADIAWRATMVHFPARNLEHREVSLVRIGDRLDVDALNVSGETLAVAKIKLGVITKILLPGQ